MRKKGANHCQQNCDPLDEDNDFTVGVESQDTRRLLSEARADSSTDVRHNDQFQNGDIGEFNPIFLDLADCVRVD